jgi:OPT family oligopeptide transporter
MAILHLNEEQVRTWSLEQKDRWWFENVWKGDMPQLTIRSALTGFMLGGVLSATNLYVGAKTGWTLGVGITSVILAFAMYRALSRIGLGRDFTILENNCMQSIATAAGYMTAPLISSLAAYMIVTEKTIPMHQMIVWNACLSILGVLFAFPMKRRFINDEQQPFPEGRACGVVLDTLYTSDASVGMFKARALLWSALGAGAIKLLQAHGIMELIQVRILQLKEVVWTFPEFLDGWFYRLAGKAGWSPTIAGIDPRQLTLRPELDLALIGAGGLMGIRAATSLLIGGIINYAILAPIMIHVGDIKPALDAAGAPILDDAGNVVYGFRNITQWALWAGVSCMVFASFTTFFAKPQIFLTAFRGLLGRGAQRSDVLRDIELPLRVFVLGIPLMSVIVIYIAWAFFGIHWWMSLLAIPLIFILSLIAANSTALTGITPTGAVSKITQLTFGVVDPGNIKTNLMTAGITAEVASNASNLLMDIKPGYMLGAKPRQQAIGHVIGIFSGALASVPLFYILFMGKTRDASGAYTNLANLQSAEFPMPAVSIWKGVAEVLTQGISTLPATALYAGIIAGIVGIAIEVSRIVTRGRFPLSAIGLGLAFVINFQYCLAMFFGAFVFWLAAKLWKEPGTIRHRLMVLTQEPICAGVIAGAALMGILDAVVTAFAFD